MSQDFGIQMPAAHVPSPHDMPVRYLVLTDAGGTRVARLFRENHDLVNEFDAAVTEVVMMIAGLTPGHEGALAEWDWAMRGLNEAERVAAHIYTIPRPVADNDPVFRSARPC